MPRCPTKDQRYNSLLQTQQSERRGLESSILITISPPTFHGAISQERGASAWLTSLPIDDHEFSLHKSAFRDPLSLQYMAGHYKIHHHTVHVAINLVSNMH